MPAEITQDVTVGARDIRAGDVFERHGKLRTATGAAGIGPWRSALVPVAGGAVYFPADAHIVVSRRVRRIPCVTA
jgi:hypothetical protein